MHHGYVDRVAIADSVLMDLLTLQQVTRTIIALHYHGHSNNDDGNHSVTHTPPQCEVLVGTFSSQLSRLALELMVARQVWGLGFRVWGLGFGVVSLMVCVQGLVPPYASVDYPWCVMVVMVLLLNMIIMITKIIISIITIMIIVVVIIIVM
jgi:hypothetical protein